VYVLREAFDYSHAEIAEILDVTESNCQQLYRRAKQHVATGRARAEVDRSTARRIVREFLAAATSGNTQRLVQLLTDDATSIGDGGGKIPARTTPVVGALAVARFLRGLFAPSTAKRDIVGGSPALYAEVVNGGPALVVVLDEQVVGVMSVTVTSDGIAALHVQVNPDKLVRATRQWSASAHGEPLLRVW
jgi:hypothetical protein